MTSKSLTKLLEVLILFSSVHHILCTCTWPTVFQSSTWWDSAQGELVFTTDSMTGYRTGTYNANEYTTSWACQEQSFDTDGIMVVRSTSTFSAFGANWFTYVCFQFTAVTSVSYTYYLLRPPEQDVGQYRVLVSTEATKTTSQVCNHAVRATGAEFVTVIKKGQETTAYITCPPVLLGRFEFNYTNSAGTVSCNDPDNTEHMNVCSDKTQLAFYVPCSGQSIVYASNSVFCVAIFTIGTDTYVQLYNNQTTVDNSATYRFSCMAISSNSKSATIVYKNCTDHQTSTYVPRSHNQAVIGASISFSPYEGGCTWPSPFVSSVWRDNTRGDITFGTDTLSGFAIVVQGSTVSNWECLDNSNFNTDGTLLIKSTDTFVYVGGTWITYLCLSMTKVTDNSYYYYQKHDQDSDGGYERGKFSTDGTLTGKATICSATSPVPAAEFHFMVKSGSESASKQWCPPSLLARMDYIHTNATGGVTCGSSTDNWDVCTNRTTMTFDYSKCATQMAYSTAGEVYCMMNITSTYEYTVLYNTDASSLYRFACIVSNSAGTAASVVYKNCTITQTPTAYAKQANGNNIGYLVTMTALETCPFLGPSTGSSTEGGGGSLIPIIVGVVVGLLLLAIIAAVTIYCLKRNRKNIQHQDEEKQKLPDDSRDGHTKTVTVAENNPALTVPVPERKLLTLPPISNHQ